MSHRIYTSTGVILRKVDVGEADSLFSFLTKDFGRVDVKAQGIRYLKSKLRYHLFGFAFIRISFVATAGDYWRLVDAEEVEVLDRIRDNKDKKKCFLSMLSLCERMIHGPESEDGLWSEFKNFVYTLEENNFSKNDLKNFEILIASRLLSCLGYFDLNILNDCRERELGVLLNKIEEKRDVFIEAIKHSLENSQL
ncbi:MAG: DNA repair protein RecO [Candidatus Marinimicrobia bacterium]|nr:DNA repair protein RecO [Candidatus Neomarinimicrobiota bacterium]